MHCIHTYRYRGIDHGHFHVQIIFARSVVGNEQIVFIFQVLDRFAIFPPADNLFGPPLTEIVKVQV